MVSAVAKTAEETTPAAGVIGELVRPAVRLDVRRLDTPSLTAAILDLERDFAVAGHWCSPEVHYFDMSLSPRPPRSRGCFLDYFTDRQTYGRTFLAPAGFRLRGEGPECRQQSLNVFVRAQPLFPDEADFGEGLADLLRDCLRLDGDSVRDTLERIAREVAEPGFAAELLVEGLGLVLVAETARALQTRRDNRGRKGGLPLWRVKLIEDRVRGGDKLPTLAELAGLCGLSRRQLTRAFREETGQTVAGFVRGLTLERAQTLLAEGDQPVATIAAQVGFANPTAFAAAFRRAVGQSPREYRATRRARRYPGAA